MNTRRILAPIDFTPSSRRALDYALATAKAEGAELTILHVCPMPLYVSPSLAVHVAEGTTNVTLEQLTREQGEAQLAAVMQAAEVDEDTTARAEIAIGDPLTVILDRLEAFDLAIIGTHGRRGVEHFFMGSVAEKIVRASAKPVITVHGRFEGPAQFPPKKILVPIDFSDGARAALMAANRMSIRHDAEVELLNVVEHPEGLHDADAVFVSLGGRDPTPLGAWARKKVADELHLFVTGDFEGELPNLHVEDGKASEAITRYAKEKGFDLIAMGTHGRTGFARFGVGSVAERVLRTSETPVMTVRRPD